MKPNRTTLARMRAMTSLRDSFVDGAIQSAVADRRVNLRLRQDEYTCISAKFQRVTLLVVAGASQILPPSRSTTDSG